MNQRHWRVALTALAAAALAGPAWAAGGHHAVDDAAILAPGACEAESWFSRSSDGERLLHAGLGCGVGLVELGISGDRARAGGTSQNQWALAAKAAHELTKEWAVGVALQAGWQARARPRYAGSTLSALLSWAPHEQVAVHFNLGHDFVHRGADDHRGGIAVEWRPTATWSLVAERYKEEGTHYARAGARWIPAQAWQVDLSRAQRLTGPGTSAWTVGLTYAWE